MCGIAGIISSNSQRVTKERLQQMTLALAHRGPDGERRWINDTGNVGLGHRRLAIIDLTEAAAQPMHYANRYTILHNGEIYNYKELRETLQQKGYTFHTQSDTEVIVAAYDCYREKCLQHFDGMFAFVIWDEKEQEFFAARDRFGEKPFFYYIDDEQFVFASEMKALWAAGIPRRVNEKMLFNYLTIGYTQNPGNPNETFFHSIHKLPARTYMLYQYREHQLLLDTYWDVEIEPSREETTDTGAMEKFHELLVRSVSRRLRSDVPLGTSLSGGLDSSSVLATMMELGQTSSYKTFSAIFPGFERDESKYISIAAERYRAANFQVQPDIDYAIKNLERISYYQEEPFQSSSIWAQFSVYELAKQHDVKVLLDGQGADEVLAGYSRYYSWYWQELFTRDKQLFKKELAAARAAGVQEPWTLKNRLAASFPSYAVVFARRQRKRQQRGQVDLERSFTSEFGESYYELPHVDLLNGVLYYNTFLNGLEELLRYADRNAMAHGVEVRLPFLQYELVQFIFSLPSRFKIRDGRTKWLLRKSMENKVPPAILERTDKVGFEPPQQQWMQNEKLQEYIRESKRALVKQGILRKSAPDKKIQPRDAHAAENSDWRFLLAGRLFL